DPEDRSRLYVTNVGAEIRTIGGDRIELADQDKEQQQGQQDGEERRDLEVVGARPIANDYDDLFLVNLDRERDDQQGEDDPSDTTVPYFGFPDFVHDPETLSPLPVIDEMFCEVTGPLMDIPCPQFVLDLETREQYEPQEAIAQFEPSS